MIFFYIFSFCNSLPVVTQTGLSENQNSELLLKLYYSLKDYARISVMRGGSHNGTPVIGGKVASDTYVEVSGSSYLVFEFPEAPFINDISFHLWDYDNRIYTYSIDLLSSNQWKNVVENMQGRGIQYVHFNDVENVKAIRIKGINTANPNLQILNDWLSFRYKL